MDKTHTLLKEQQKIFTELSEILPESRQEIIPNRGEEQVMMKEDRRKICRRKSNANESDVDPKTPCKKRKVSCGRGRKQSKSNSKEVGGRGNGGCDTAKEENIDSGFIASNEVVNSATFDAHCTGANDFPSELFSDVGSDSQGSSTSMESVSLLQQSVVTSKEQHLDSVVDISWNMKKFPSTESEVRDIFENSDAVHGRADKSVQTLNFCPRTHSDKTTEQSVNFLGSVIRLRHLLSSKSKICEKELTEILKPVHEFRGVEPSSIRGGNATALSRQKKRTATAKNSNRISHEDSMPEETISCETIYYVTRTMNMDSVAEKSVDSVVSWLKDEVTRNWRNSCGFWGSLAGDAVDVLNEAVVSNVGGARERVSDFLRDLYSDIQVLHHPVKDSELEFRTSFLSNFPKSVPLLYDLLVEVMRNLPGARTNGSKLDAIASAKKSYFSLRLLNDLLQLYLTDLNKNEVGRSDHSLPPNMEPGVVEMWRSHWKKESKKEDNDDSQVVLRTVKEWCHRIDETLRFCMREAPLLLLVAQRCSESANEVISVLERRLSQC